jgi:hypothetical protein
VVPDWHIIAWLEVLNGELLYGECIQPSELGHKSMLFCLFFFLKFDFDYAGLELKAQYW